VPVLARTLEAAGLATVLVTNVPFWVAKTGVPRALAVEFPFAHTLGQPHDVEGQMRVILQALDVLETAQAPGTMVHSPETWPAPQPEALQDWQPAEPSPVVQVMAPRVREILRQQRKTRPRQRKR
jgi:D-proline reductase (dithiol) PrdB